MIDGIAILCLVIAMGIARATTFYLAGGLLLVLLVLGTVLRLQRSVLAAGVLAFIVTTTWIGIARGSQVTLGAYGHFGGVHHINVGGGYLAMGAGVIFALLTLVWLFLFIPAREPLVESRRNTRRIWAASVLALCGGYFFFFQRPYRPWARPPFILTRPLAIAPQIEDPHTRYNAWNHTVRTGSRQDVQLRTADRRDVNAVSNKATPLGIGSRMASSVPGQEWRNRANALVSKVRVAWRQWSLTHVAYNDDNWIDALRNPRFVASIMHARTVRVALFDLWRVTGHCAFAHVPPEHLVEKAPEIVAAYVSMLDKQPNLTARDVALRGVETCIAMTRSAYCLPALCFLSEYVLFRAPIRATCDDFCPAIDHDVRCRLHDELEAWLVHHKPTLYWDSHLGMFTAGPHGYTDFLDYPIAWDPAVFTGPH